MSNEGPMRSQDGPLWGHLGLIGLDLGCGDSDSFKEDPTAPLILLGQDLVPSAPLPLHPSLSSRSSLCASSCLSHEDTVLGPTTPSAATAVLPGLRTLGALSAMSPWGHESDWGDCGGLSPPGSTGCIELTLLGLWWRLDLGVGEGHRSAVPTSNRESSFCPSLWPRSRLVAGPGLSQRGASRTPARSSCCAFPCASLQTPRAPARRCPQGPRVAPRASPRGRAPTQLAGHALPLPHRLCRRKASRRLSSCSRKRVAQSS